MEKSAQGTAPFKAGDFIMLRGGEPLQVVYADADKAVCLRLFTDHAGGWCHTGEAVAISNDPEHYKSTNWLSTAQDLKITGRFQWNPVTVTMSFGF